VDQIPSQCETLMRSAGRGNQHIFGIGVAGHRVESTDGSQKWIGLLRPDQMQSPDSFCFW